MNDRLGLRPLALAAVAVAVAVAAVLFLARRDGESPPLREPRSIATVRNKLTPRTPAFGDRMMAEVVVVVDRELVVPGSIQVNARFDPYELAGPVERDAAEIGRLLRVRYRYTLDCLSEACTPSADTPVIELPRARVAYRYSGTAGRAGQNVRWPPLRVAPRVGPAELEAALWRADTRAVSAASYRISPGILAAILIGTSIALVLVAGAIVYRLLGAHRRAVAEVEVDARPPLDRALELARLASRNGGTPERRKALERVARELVGLGLPDLADRARTIAWSPAGPSAEAVEQLERDARSATGGTGS